jgi:RNA polymerase sigma-70 factor (ECF subfamily)
MDERTFARLAEEYAGRLYAVAFRMLGHRADAEDAVQRAFDAVPREARLLLALHYVDGLSYRELAAVRGISVNTVKSQLARGKALMKRALEG